MEISYFKEKEAKEKEEKEKTHATAAGRATPKEVNIEISSDAKVQHKKKFKIELAPNNLKQAIKLIKALQELRRAQQASDKHILFKVLPPPKTTDSPSGRRKMAEYALCLGLN